MSGSFLCIVFSERAHSIAGMRRFYTTLILGVIGGAVVLAQDAQDPAGKIDSEGNQMAGCRADTRHCRSGGITDGCPKRRSQEAGTIYAAAAPSAKYEDLAHSHQDDRTACVLSGDWYFGYGREFDEAALKEMPAGSFYTEPPGVEHFGQTKTRKRLSRLQATDQPALHTSIQRTTR